MSLSLLLERFRISKYNLFDLFLRYFENFKLHIISFSLLEGWQSKEYTSFNTTNSSKSRIIWEKTRISIYNTLTIRIPEHIPEEIPRNIKHFLLLRTRFTWATKYVLLYLDKYIYNIHTWWQYQKGSFLHPTLSYFEKWSNSIIIVFVN